MYLYNYKKKPCNSLNILVFILLIGIMRGGGKSFNF